MKIKNITRIKQLLPLILLLVWISIIFLPVISALGQTVVNPIAVTVTQYQPGKISVNPTIAASLISTYLNPMFSQVGFTPLTPPALTSRVTIQNYADGSATITVQYASTLPNPPAGP
jgi:hypothetical protein